MHQIHAGVSGITCSRLKPWGFSGINNFPTHSIVDGLFRQVLEETGMSVQHEINMVALAQKKGIELFSDCVRRHP